MSFNKWSWIEDIIFARCFMLHHRWLHPLAILVLLMAVSGLPTAARAQNPVAKQHADRGNELVTRGKYREAITEYSNAIAADPKYAKAYAFRGNTYLRFKEYDQALQDAEAALKLDPTLEDPYNTRGIVLGQGKQQQAIADFTEAIRLNPRQFAYYSNRAWAYNLNKEYLKALADCDQALTMTNSDALTYNSAVWHIHPWESTTRR